MIWKVLPSNKNYSVSDRGEIKSNKRGKLISQQKINSGYKIAHLYKHNLRVARTVHSLVAEAFIRIRKKGFDVSHRNGIRTDNRLQNLKYATRKENVKDRIRHGTIYDSNTAAKLTINEVRKIRKLSKNFSYQKLGIMFKVHDETIRKLVKRESWKYIK